MRLSRWWSRTADDADRAGDAGAATVFTAFAVAVLVAAVLGGLSLASAVAARHRAQAAADLAALAAAQLLPAGKSAACRQAEALATSMGARLDDCTVERLDVLVSVTVGLAQTRGLTAGAVARAGPAPLRSGS